MLFAPEGVAMKKRAAGTRMVALAAVLAGFTICQAARIDRIDIYDKSDNPLLFVTFAYDSSGANIGRSVFASDSTFLRSTTFQTTGTTVKETSKDFDDNLVFTTTINTVAGGASSFSTVDQFGLDQFGGSMSYSLASANNYSFSQNSGPTYQEQYLYAGDGTLNRINILDAGGSLMYYALVSVTAGVAARPRAMTGQISLITANRGHIKVRLALVHSGTVSVELFTLAGRRVAVLVNKVFSEGNHAFEVSALGTNDNQLGNGAYIIRMTIDGVTAVCNKAPLQR